MPDGAAAGGRHAGDRDRPQIRPPGALPKSTVRRSDRSVGLGCARGDAKDRAGGRRSGSGSVRGSAGHGATINATRQQGGRAVVIAMPGMARPDAQSGGLQIRVKACSAPGRRRVPGPRLRPLRAAVELRTVPVRDLLSKPYSLTQVDQALQDLAAGKISRPLIDMSLR